MNTEKTHFWHRIEPTALLVTVILVPLTVWLVSSHFERDKTNLAYVRLAIGVLQPAKKDQQPQKELRSWAVQILQASSPVKLSSAATQSLINGEFNLPQSAYGSDSISYGYSLDADGKFNFYSLDDDGKATLIPLPKPQPAPKPPSQ